MSFQIAARTILQLGAELISSDDIAFYELIKNAIDAKSPRVQIEIVIRLSHATYVALRDNLTREKNKSKKISEEKIEELREEIESSILPGSPQIKEYKQQLAEAVSIDELLGVLDEANYIDIEDWGEGMSLADLQDVYLTIGTRSRYKQRQESIVATDEAQSSRPLLGEKGVGRLSVMRLGDRLQVITSKYGETNWNNLEIDWNWFSHDSEKMLEDIEVAPEYGEKKADKIASGTLIHISNLTSYWTAERVRKIVNDNFSRFADPFSPEDKYPIEIYFNDGLIQIPNFDQEIFKYAHAIVRAEFSIETNERTGELKSLKLQGTVKYRLQDVKKSFDLNTVEVLSASEAESPSTLKSLGPFRMKAYWFNRQLLAKGTIPNFQYVKNLVNEWGGGLMLYRDGFRVFPYGNKDDDWLDLDRKALGSQGYKVNRSQIIGKVDIGSRKNPRLIDQTNREGLRDCDEKRVFINLLKYILEGEMRAFLLNVDKKLDLKKQLDLDVVEERFEDKLKSAYRRVRQFVDRVPEEERDLGEIQRLNKSFDELRDSMKEARALADSYKEGSELTVHLAGIGLLVESLAHELNRAASNALTTLSHTRNENLPSEVKSQFKSLEAQMKTLQKRLQILDPVGTAARQKKVTFDMVSWIKEILAGHEPQFERHDIEYSVTVVPAEATEWKVRAVKGMIVQVIENLISNSVYWLKQQREISKAKIPIQNNDSSNSSKLEREVFDQSLSPRIDVVIDVFNHEIEFTDNGPGISPELKENIFLPYVTHKPAGEGKGLGLYISREIAAYHDASLFLSPVPSKSDSERLNTFIFRLEAGNTNGK